MDLPGSNSAPAAELAPVLLACCDVPAWSTAVIDRRPYGDSHSLLATADAAARQFTRADVDRALAAHPRIGGRAHRAGTEAGWSRQEQSGVAEDAGTRQALADANRAYGQRFGRVFLICATGLSGAEVLDRLSARLASDDETEAALLRLRRVVGA